MRLVFAGTPDFAVPALEALAARHEIVAIYSQPDRPAGRGRQLQPPPVARRANELKLPLRQPPKLDAAEIEALRALAPDAMVVVAYGLILPPAVLAVPRLGCFNIHASLLPRWRGAAPIARAILAGDGESGITIMRMDAGLDTGPMLRQEALPIGPDMTAAALHDALAPMGARLMAQVLDALAHGPLPETPQPQAGISYARKLAKDEARLDWSLPAAVLARAVRGYNPAPVAWTELGAERIRIFRARAEATETGAAAPGTIVAAGAEGIDVACGAGLLRITELQRPGGRALPAAELARSWPLAGQRFR